MLFIVHLDSLLYIHYIKINVELEVNKTASWCE